MPAPISRQSRILLWSGVTALVLTAFLAVTSHMDPPRAVGVGLSVWLVLVLGGAGVLRITGTDADDFDTLRQQVARMKDGDTGHVTGDGAAAPLAHELNRIFADTAERIAATQRHAGQRDAVLAGMRDGVLAVDHHSRVILLNPAARRLFGMEGVATTGRPLEQVVRHPDLIRLVARIRRERNPLEEEVQLDRDGTTRRLLVTASPIAGSGGAVLVLADVTRVRELEEMRRDFAANVSHELKTPITAIKGAVTTLIDGAAEEPEARDRFLSMLARQADRLERLVSDTLSLSRVEQEVEHGTAPLSLAELAPVLEAALADCEAHRAERGVIIHYTPPTGLTCAMDGPMLEQAVVNLLDNAISHSPEGGEVTLAVEAEPDGIVIRVTDHGPGIDPVHHPRLFERFYRVDSGRASKDGGTGLGLAIVKHVALAHGGRVSVQSAPGRGASFRIHLPTA